MECIKGEWSQLCIKIKNIGFWKQNKGNDVYRLYQDYIVIYIFMKSALQSITHHYQEIMKNPQNYEAIFQIGLIHYHHQQYQEALTYFTKAYENSYKSSVTAQYIGNIYYYQQQDEAAVHWYEISVTANVFNDSPYNSLGVICKKQGKIKEAMSYYSQCLQRNPKNSLAHYGTANIYYDMKNYERALHHYNLSIQANPNYDAPYIGRGNVYKRQGKNNQASKEYLKSIYLNPKNQAAIRNLRTLPIKERISDDLAIKQFQASLSIGIERLEQNFVNSSFAAQKSGYDKAVSNLESIKKVQPIIRKPTNCNRQEPQESEEHSLKTQLKLMRQEFTNMIVQLTNCLSKGEDLGKRNERLSKPSPALKDESHLSARDRELIIQIESNYESTDLTTIQSWFLKMMNEVVSTSFNFYLNNQMTYNQARVYCCQKILTNIYLFVSKGHQQLKPSFMSKINKFMEESLQYIKYKYPLNEELEVPYKLEHFISSNKKDNTDSIEYDYFSHYPYDYEYRQSGIYNDIIMKMINNLINTSNTNYYSFKQTMTKLFENVFDPNWKKEEIEEQKEPIKKGKNLQRERNQSPSPANSKSPIPIHKISSQSQMEASPHHLAHTGIFNMMKSFDPPASEMAVSQNIQSQHSFHEKKKEEHQANRKKREHRQKVQAYTSYVIKRKIPQFVKCYSDEEIRNINILKIKDKSIFRILTKWCQELWEKFEISGYFLNKVSLLMLKDKKLFYLGLNHKEELNNLIEEEKREIKKFIEKISKDCNMKMQFHLFTRWLKYEDQIQNNTGIFSANVVESLEYFTISYLNRLIHGLLRVSKKFSERHLDETHPQLLLLTFRIKDLLRCRFKSKQEQSEKVLRHILQEAEVTVLRVKNRLNDNNNDIMINLFFEKMICEIQLAVQTNTSKFIECSNNFNHFLYELERSYFGPITQMSNIWQCHDKRMKHYKKIEEKRIEGFRSKENNCNHLFQRIDEETEPFICSCCNRIYYHYNYIVSHKRCIHCKSINCGNCRLSYMSDQQLKKYFNIDFIGRYIDSAKDFPQLSYLLLKEGSYDQLGAYYIRYQKRCKNYLVSIKNTEGIFHFQLISELTQKSIKGLLKKYVIVEVPHNYQQTMFKQKIEETLIHAYIKQTLVEEKDELSLSDFLIGDEQLKNMLDQQLKVYRMNENSCKIKKLIIDRASQGKIKKQYLDHIISDFSHLQYLWIANNHLDHLPKFKNPSNIIMINLQRTQLKELEKHGQLENFSSLQFLIINNSHLTEIPIALKSINTLVHLEICSSSIKHLHDSIFKHLGSSLVYLNLSMNQLEKLPESIKDLQNLEFLNVSNNQLICFPINIVYNISLAYLNLSQNSLRRIPENLQNLVNLECLELSSCDLTTILANFSRFTHLKKVNLTSNKLKSISFLENCKISKQILITRGCQEPYLPKSSNGIRLNRLGDCQTVTLTNLSLGQSIQGLRFSNISELTVNACRIAMFPDVHYCHSLKRLDLSTNFIRKVREEDLEGLKELKEMILSENPQIQLPENLEMLEKLESMELQRCELKVVPLLKNVNKLTTLKLGKNHFSSITNSLFESTPNLRILDLRDNSFMQQSVLQQIKLRQSDNLSVTSHEETKEEQYLTIGDRIDLLQNLEELYLSNCCIKEIPKNIEKCHNLSVLRLELNRISHFPKKLEGLSKLDVLRIDGNSVSKMKDIQLLRLSSKILPSMTILKYVLSDYSGSDDDSEQQAAINAFAIRFSNEIKETISDYEGEAIQKYGQTLADDIRMIHMLLKIESEFAVVSDILNKITCMLEEKKFSEKYLHMMKDSFWRRLYEIQNEEFHILKHNRLKIHNYAVCYRQININSKVMRQEGAKNGEISVEEEISQVFKDHSDFQGIFKKYNQVRPMFLDSIKELMEISASQQLNLEVSIRYYPFLQEIAMPIDVKQSKVVSSQEQQPINEELKQFKYRYPFYRFNTMKDKSQILEKAYFISGAQTKLISSKIVL